jgi:polysaccharide biosynthesis/export protein
MPANLTICKKWFLGGLCFCVLAMTVSSCGNTRQLIYMQGKFDTARLSEVKAVDPVIKKGDLLGIIVYSDNPGATALYNQTVSGSGSNDAGSNGGGTGSTAGAQQAVAVPSAPGYQVDELGNIQFQGLGLLHVEGLTKSQLKQLLDSRLKDFLVNPYYNIRFLNYKFTMLGEVNRPGIYTIPGEEVNILQALGLAGDMTFYGRRDNVLVVRETNGKRTYGRLDLTKPEIMASPYFYLQQNDVVIFEPNNKKIVANDQVTTRNVSIAVSVVSTLAILYSIFRK